MITVLHGSSGTIASQIAAQTKIKLRKVHSMQWNRWACHLQWIEYLLLQNGPHIAVTNAQDHATQQHVADVGVRKPGARFKQQNVGSSAQEKFFFRPRRSSRTHVPMVFRKGPVVRQAAGMSQDRSQSEAPRKWELWNPSLDRARQFQMPRGGESKRC